VEIEYTKTLKIPVEKIEEKYAWKKKSGGEKEINKRGDNH